MSSTTYRRSLLSIVSLERRDIPSVSFEQLPIVPDLTGATLASARQTAAVGRQVGHRHDAFVKVGDSNSDFAGYLTPLGDPGYNAQVAGLGHRADLVATLNAFRAPVDAVGLNSFARNSSADAAGWTVADARGAVPGELAATNAGIALVMIGTNDVVRFGNPELFRNGLTELVAQLQGNGVVPVLSTIPDLTAAGGAFEPLVRQFNQVIADVGEARLAPVWNLWRALQGLPNDGLLPDGLHLSLSPSGGGAFTVNDLSFGQNVRNFSALEVLTALRQKVLGAEAVAGPTPPPQAAGPTGNWKPLYQGRRYFATGPDAGEPPFVTVYDADLRQPVFGFFAYDPAFRGGVQVALGDVNNDGTPDVITAPRDGGGPNVRAYSGTDGSLLLNFFAYESSFRGGANAAVGDLDGDGINELVVGSGVGGGPRVRVFRTSDMAVVKDFFAYEDRFRGGVNVAVATFAWKTGPQIVTGSGVGGGPVVKVFDFDTTEMQESFFAYEDTFRGGVYVTAGDLDRDGLDGLVTGKGDGSPHVRVFDPYNNVLKLDYFSGEPTDPGGVRVAVVPTSDDREPLLITGNGPGAASVVRVYEGLNGDFGLPEQPGDWADLGGVFVGG